MTNTSPDKPGKTSFSEKLITVRDNILSLLNAIYLGEKTFSFFLDKIINLVKVFIVSTRKFIDDDCFTKASAIAYTSIISLIPALTVALTLYSTFQGVAGQKEELFSMVAAFMQDHNLQINIDPVLGAISSLIDNAGRIGGIGAAVMIFTATAMLRSLEKSLNDIYRVRRHRSIFMKIIYYWAALTLGPVMIIAATTVATQLTETLSSPNYKSAQIQNDIIWVVGNKGSLNYSSTDNLRFRNISDKAIDFDNQKAYSFEKEDRTFHRDPDQRVTPADFTGKRLVDMQFIGQNGWAVSNDGIILTTTDGGKKWSLTSYARLRFSSIKMINSQRGFIAGANSLLLKTIDGGSSWEIIKSGDIFTDFRNITFRNNIGVITGTRAKILITQDYGDTWQLITVEEAIRKQRHLNINNAFILDNQDIIIIGDEGTILQSRDGAETWTYKNFKRNNYQTIYFFDSQTGVIGGERGTMIFTDDGGYNWYEKSLPTYRVNRILHSNGTLWAVGDAGMVMYSRDMGATWSGVEGRSLIAFVINFFGPFAFIWVLFLMAYMSLPNIKVPFTKAAIGAAFTSAVWVIFILLFISYIQAFARGTFAIYGALVAIPLFLLMVYSSAVIILYGAQVSYTLMHPGSYRTLKKSSSDKQHLNIFFGINILLAVYSKFEKGNGPTTLKELLKNASNDDTQADQFIKIFMENKLIAQDTEGNFFPTRSSEKIQISEVIDLIHSISFSLPPGARRSSLKSWLSDLFDKMSNSRNKILGGVTLRELIEKKNT